MYASTEVKIGDVYNKGTIRDASSFFKTVEYNKNCKEEKDPTNIPKTENGYTNWIPKIVVMGTTMIK